MSEQSEYTKADLVADRIESALRSSEPRALYSVNLTPAAWRLVIDRLRSVPSEIDTPDEGYPGIAHDFETMRTALRRIIKVSDQFVKDTGLKHGDPLTDAVDAARGLVARNPQAAWPFPKKAGAPTPNRHAELIARLRLAVESGVPHAALELPKMLTQAADALQSFQRNAP